jgi:hypothetical protein
MFWVLVGAAVLVVAVVVCIAVEYLLRRSTAVEPEPIVKPGSRGTVDSTGYLLADQGLQRLGWRVRDRHSKRQ